MTWNDLTPEQKREATRPLIAEGLSFSQVAIQLGAPSRLAIAGVLERSRRSGHPIVVDRQQARQNHVRAIRARFPIKEKPVPKPRRKTFAFIPDIPEDAIDRVPARTDVWNALPGSSPVPVEHHTNGCRWPCNADLPFTFCNEPVESGPYCAVHSAIAFRAALPVTRLPKGARS